MGTRGHEKAYDMSRSGLPASRGHALVARRGKRAIHGAVRARERAAARRVLNEGHEDAEVTGTLAHAEVERRRGVYDLVRCRQQGDKLGALFRWMYGRFRGAEPASLRTLYGLDRWW